MNAPAAAPLLPNTWLVGGAVRDALLGLPVTDRDWVVVGATPQQMVDAGFLPVGRDFPVFLHPRTHEEYALARTERKTGAGYHGFAFHAAPDVTLEDDLARRDLTINAIAQHPQTGERVDPLRRPGRPGRESAAPRGPGLPRRPGAAAAAGALRGALSTLHGGRRDDGRVARHGGRRRGGRAGARTRVAGAVARPDAAQAQPHVRGAARLRRAGEAAARDRPPVGRAATGTAPPGNRHRRAPDAGAGQGRAAGRAAAGALRLPVPRPGQGNNAARGVAAPHRPRGAQRGPDPRAGRTLGACPTTAANWRW